MYVLPFANAIHGIFIFSATYQQKIIFKNDFSSIIKL